MRKSAAYDLPEALRPVESLISKSEKALQKLAPGTWQRRMLEENLRALHMAFALMEGRAISADVHTQENLHSALRALADMASRTEKAGAKFAPGTSHHTLQQNRLKALRTAGALLLAETKSIL